MQNNIAIKIEDLSKQYRLGVIGTGTLSHDINRWWARLRGKPDPTLKIGQANVLNQNEKKKANDNYVWALRDINLDVKQGEVLGIIGKNGAGKSTLLKILSRVTAPTTGQIKVRGRIASLLEVGTGFHPELTGRENIFLNGAILGMTRTEIRSKLDEIVEFAGIAKYADTPVKRYSSGMYVRLAFAVAAHLDPEILVVDEVLAVGDAEFQKKAIGKMQDVSKGGGRTVLFVSHNMGSVRQLCNRGMLLENGQVKFTGDIEKTVENYLLNDKIRIEYTKESNGGLLFIKNISFKEHKNSFDFSEDITFIIEIVSKKDVGQVSFGFAILNKFQNRVFTNMKPFNTNIKKTIFEVTLPKEILSPGKYSLTFGIDKPNQVLYDLVENVLHFEIVDKGIDLSIYNAFYGDVIVKSEIKQII